MTSKYEQNDIIIFLPTKRKFRVVKVENDGVWVSLSLNIHRLDIFEPIYVSSHNPDFKSLDELTKLEKELYEIYDR